MTVLIVLSVIVSIAILLTVLRIIFRPPSLEGRTASSSLSMSSRTTLGRAIMALSEGHGHESGVLALQRGIDAFGARIALIRAAEESLDLQYYIWQRDLTGLVLLEEVRQAAERGVRIRLLLDDNGIAARLDNDLAELNAMPTVEVRLFNPFILRRPKSLGYAFDFLRLNRRMHNKALIADGAATILGGRNIGDIYFSYGEGPHYLDTDVLAVGEVAKQAGEEFDGYWHSQSAYPIERILSGPNGRDCATADLNTALQEQRALEYRKSVETQPLVQEMIEHRLALDWVPVKLISDDPAKGVGKVRRRDLLFAQLMRMISDPKSSVEIVSAYFVPGKRFADRLVKLVADGRRVRILTNSQEATDVLVVHSAYVKYRPKLLDGGVELFELKAMPAQPKEPRVRGASTRASLHSKTLTVDDERVFIGSFNFDPRSVMLNTEMGVVIDSPKLAKELSAGFDELLPSISYGPRRDQFGLLIWNDPAGQAETVHYSEPGTNFIQRRVLWLIGRLPIEWLL